MPTFVAICAKNGQRVELTLNKPTIDEARAELHHQGYSISDIRELDPAAKSASENLATFYFEILVDGKVKAGQILSSDSLRAYVKLTESLHYQVLSLCDNPSASPEEKRFFTNKILEMYSVYVDKQKGPKQTEEEKKGPSIDDPDTTPNIIAKQVAKYHEVIQKTTSKVETMLATFPEQLGPDRVLRMKELVGSLKQLKNIQNPDKLRIIGEAALDRIGQLEIELIQKGYIEKKKEALGNTNQLLKGLGSTKRVVLPEDDFVVQVKRVWNAFREEYLNPVTQKRKASEQPKTEADVSMSEFMYFKNVRELKAYEAKRSEIGKELFRGIFTLRGEKRERLLLKRKLVDQNIELLSNRIKNRSVSYVRIKRGVSKVSEALFYLTRSFGDLAGYVVFAYSIAYSVMLPVSKLTGMATVQGHRFAMQLAAASFVAFCLKQARSWPSLAVFSGTAFVFAAALGVNF